MKSFVLPILSLVLVLPLFAAPAPLPKVTKPVPPEITESVLIGDWDCMWFHVNCKVYLREGGRYGCLYCGTTYEGTWVVTYSNEGKSTLTIRETCNKGQTWLTWIYPVTRSPGHSSPDNLTWNPDSSCNQITFTRIYGPRN